jgi:hypothetical protein
VTEHDGAQTIEQTEEDELVANTEASGKELADYAAGRGTSRAQDLVDLAYAYHWNLVACMRDSTITREQRLQIMRIVERVQDLAAASAEKCLETHGFLKACDT